MTREDIIDQSPENILKFIENYNQLTKFEITSRDLKTLANEIIFENRTLKESISKKELENYIKDIIVNCLSIKVGFNQRFEKLFVLGRTHNLDVSPNKFSERIPCEAEVGETVFVCVNNEKPYVSSPGIVVQKGNDNYTIFYFTNHFRGKESKLLEN